MTEKRETLDIVVPKGKKAIYKAKAAYEGKSLNEWILSLMRKAK